MPGDRRPPAPLRRAQPGEADQGRHGHQQHHRGDSEMADPTDHPPVDAPEPSGGPGGDVTELAPHRARRPVGG